MLLLRLQVDFVVQLLERFSNLDTIIVSDVDTVWLRDPRDYLAQHPAAEWFASTDCLSHAVSRASFTRAIAKLAVWA